MVEKFHAERFNIAKLPRQSGKSTIVTSYLLWYVLFNDNVNNSNPSKQSSDCKRDAATITTKL